MRFKLLTCLSIMILVLTGCSENAVPLTAKSLALEPLYTSDTRWNDLSIEAYSSEITINNGGSAMLSFIIVSNYFNDTQLTPLDMDRDYYYTSFDWFRAAESHDLGFKEYGLLSNLNINEITKEEINAGSPLILYIEGNENPNTRYVVAYGYEEDDAIMIIDPMDSSIHYLSELIDSGYWVTSYVVFEPLTDPIEYLTDDETLALINPLIGIWSCCADEAPIQSVIFTIDDNNNLYINHSVYETEINNSYFQIERIIIIDDNNYVIDANLDTFFTPRNSSDCIHSRSFMQMYINIEDLANNNLSLHFGYAANSSYNSDLTYQLKEE